MATGESPYYTCPLVRLVPLMLVVACAAGCQCAQVPELCFNGEPCPRDDAGRDAGSDAGFDAGVDAGVDAGFDAGVDAGVDAGFDAGVDAGVDAGCGWPCIQALLAQLPSAGKAPPDFAVQRVTPLGYTNATNCTERWRGGVLLPGGKVLAFPYCANRLLLIDPAVPSASVVGPPITGWVNLLADGGVGKYAGGSLGCDGFAYAFPYDHGLLLRVDVAGAFTTATSQISIIAEPIEAVGGVIGPTCALWTATSESVHRWTPPPPPATNTAVQRFAPASAVDRTGLVRMNDQQAWLAGGTGFAAGVWRLDFATGAVSLTTTAFGPTPFHGGSLGVSGAAHFIDPATGGLLALFPDGGQFVRTADAGTGFRWPAFRGDGFIYALGDTSLLAAAESQGGVTYTLLDGMLTDAGPSAFSGLVATPSGVLVAIPGNSPDVLLLIPDGGATAPAQVLLSPFFNKL